MRKRKRRQADVPLHMVWPDNAGEVFDPLGSYTGKAADPFDKPVQDADDL